VLIVGDTEIDILLAKRSGVVLLGILRICETERCRALKPEHEISGIEELPAIAGVPENATACVQPAQRPADLVDEAIRCACVANVEVIERVIIGARLAAVNHRR